MHFHVISAKNGYRAISNVRFDDYDEGLLAYVRLTQQFFEDTVDEPSMLSLAYAKAATGWGDGHGAFVGTDQISLYFIPCDEPKCYSPTWN